MVANCKTEKVLLNSKSKYFRIEYYENNFKDLFISSGLDDIELKDVYREKLRVCIDDYLKNTFDLSFISNEKSINHSFTIEEKSGKFDVLTFSLFKSLDKDYADRIYGVLVEQSIEDQTSNDKKVFNTANILKDTVNILPAVFYVKSTDGKYLLINETYRSLFKITDKEVLGNSDYDIFDENIASIFRKNDLEIVKNKKMIEIKEEAIDSEGNIHHYNSYKFPYIDKKGEVIATGGLSLDITELVNSQRHLKASLETLEMNNRILDLSQSNDSKEGKLKKVVDIMRDVEWFDEDFSVSLYMLESETKANMVASYNIDKEMSDYWPLREKFSKYAISADDELLTPKEFRHDGIYYYGIQLHAEKGHIGCLFFRTNREYKEDAYHRLYLKAFSRAVIDLLGKEQTRMEFENQKRIMLHNAKLASIGELAAGIGHEINNPLAILHGFLDTFRRRRTQRDFSFEEEEKYFSKITRAADRIGNIVKSLRTFSRADTDDVEEFDVLEALSDSYTMVSEIFSKEGIELSINEKTDANEIYISGNRGRLLQVFMNLLTNARDATESKERRIISIQTKLETDTLEIFFRDNGTGVEEKLKEKIFDPFFTTKDVNKGTGIGLSLVYNIVSEHGGNISLKNLEEGCEFKIQLPLAK